MTEIEAYKAQVLAWLERRRDKWQKTAEKKLGAASDAASFYAAAYDAALDGIIDGEPEKRAAIEASEP